MFKKKKSSTPAAPEYLEPYASAAKVHGEGFGTLLWRNADGQASRFRVIMRMIEPERTVMADLGCGRADLLSYLAKHRGLPKGYFGIDGITDMVRAGKTVIRDLGASKAEMIEADFVADRDLFQRLVAEKQVNGFVFSGSLNTLKQEQALVVLGRAFEVLPPRGLMVFNFLSNRLTEGGNADTGPAYRFDTLAMLDWAMHTTPLVRFRHDYLRGHDATLRMQKP